MCDLFVTELILAVGRNAVRGGSLAKGVGFVAMEEESGGSDNSKAYPCADKFVLSCFVVKNN